jgi:spermidine/putrescine ABC transporter ATP-binding subunit
MADEPLRRPGTNSKTGKKVMMNREQPDSIPIEAMVNLFSLTKQFGSVLALNEVDLEIQKGEFFALLGPSGSGKTTLLSLIAGFHEPSSGRVIIGGVDVTAIPSYKRNLAMMFQNYALFPHLNIFDNVGFGLRMRGVPKERIRERVKKVLSLVRLEGYEDRWYNQLSGGQQQRVALARALVVEPKVLLLDEPLSAMDKGLRDEMRIELKEIHRNLGITTIFVTHDQNEAISLSDRVAIMEHGRIIQVDTPRQIHAKPRNSFVARFLGLQNVFSGRMIRREKDFVWIEPISGGPPLVSLSESHRDQEDFSFYIRPERICIVNQAREREFNQLSGFVNEITYQGVYNEIMVELGAGTHLMIYDVTERDADGLQAGSQISLSINPKDIVII